MSWWLPVGQHMHFWSVCSLVLSTESPPAPPCTHTPTFHWTEESTWAECAGLASLAVTLGLTEMRSFWDQSVPRLLFSFPSFNATELRSLLLLMSLHCSTWLLHQKRKDSFDLDMLFFSVPFTTSVGKQKHDWVHLWCQSCQGRTAAFIRCLPKTFNALMKSKSNCQRTDPSIGFITIPTLLSVLKICTQA